MLTSILGIEILNASRTHTVKLVEVKTGQINHYKNSEKQEES